MTTIDVSDLPEPLVRAVRDLVETFRRELATAIPPAERPGNKPSKLPVWSLGVTGKLTREEIYEDYP